MKINLKKDFKSFKEEKAKMGLMSATLKLVYVSIIYWEDVEKEGVVTTPMEKEISKGLSQLK